MNSRRLVLTSSVVALVGTIITAGPAAHAQLSDTFNLWLDHPALDYESRQTTDAVSDLNRKIQNGEVQLQDKGPSGYLQSVLEALRIPIASQIVVFAKDSVQAPRINPSNPRTIFFNDSAAVGWVRGGFIEIAAQDPEQGVIFYTLNQTSGGNPLFTRRDGCLTCHYSHDTVGVPGMLVRSVYTAPDGKALFQLGSHMIDHRSPLEHRWGGWYVTGTHGSMRHMGNAMVANPEEPESMVTSDTLNVKSLERKFDTSAYLSSNSDIAALMVFEHQMHMMNLLSRIGWEARVAEYQKQNMKAPPGRVPDVQSDTPVPVGDGARELVDYLLFIDEAPLTDTIQGSTEFADTFASQGPQDHVGRSLRQLDLKRRLMRYPCSYMIYSAQFDRLPLAAKSAIFARIWNVLSGTEKGPRYRRLSVDDRRAIVEILWETKKDLPEYFKPIIH